MVHVQVMANVTALCCWDKQADDEIPPPRQPRSQGLISLLGAGRERPWERGCLRDGTEPTVFVPEAVKQHDVFARAITFDVFVNSRAIHPTGEDT